MAAWKGCITTGGGAAGWGTAARKRCLGSDRKGYLERREEGQYYYYYIMLLYIRINILLQWSVSNEVLEDGPIL